MSGNDTFSNATLSDAPTITIGDKIAIPTLACSLIFSGFVFMTLYAKKGNKAIAKYFQYLMIYNAVIASMNIAGVALCYYYERGTVGRTAGIKIIALVQCLIHLSQLFILLLDCEFLIVVQALDHRITRQRIKYFRYFCIGLYCTLMAYDIFFTISILGDFVTYGDSTPDAVLIGIWGAFVFLWDNAQNLYIGYLFFNFNKKNAKSIVFQRYRNVQMMIAFTLSLDWIILVFFILSEQSSLGGFSLAFNSVQNALLCIHTSTMFFIFYGLKDLAFAGNQSSVHSNQLSSGIASSSKSPTNTAEANKPTLVKTSETKKPVKKVNKSEDEWDD